MVNLILCGLFLPRFKKITQNKMICLFRKTLGRLGGEHEGEEKEEGGKRGRKNVYLTQFNCLLIILSFQTKCSSVSKVNFTFLQAS